MPNTRDLRRRISSIRNTSQITKAMQMVAASKMRRAQQSALAGRPYADLLSQVMAEAVHHSGDFSHPLLEPGQGDKTCLVVVSTDKGLCGALNSNLLREAIQRDPTRPVDVAAGYKAAQVISRVKRTLLSEFTYKDAPLHSEARAIAKFVVDLFLNGQVRQVDILFTHFISTLTQKPAVHQLLPVGEIRGLGFSPEGAAQPEELLKGSTEFEFEPSAGEVFAQLLPHYITFQVYQVLLEAKASEHSARMVAMKNATDNANQLIKDLTLEYNKIRQASITKELLEISSATMALG